MEASIWYDFEAIISIINVICGANNWTKLMSSLTKIELFCCMHDFLRLLACFFNQCKTLHINKYVCRWMASDVIKSNIGHVWIKNDGEQHFFLINKPQKLSLPTGHKHTYTHSKWHITKDLLLHNIGTLIIQLIE